MKNKHPYPYNRPKRGDTKDGVSKELRRRIDAKLNLFEEAQAGDQELLDYFLREHCCKVYTQEEVDLLNILTKGGERKLLEAVVGVPETDVYEQEVVLPLPTLRGERQEARLLSLKDLGEIYYLAHCTLTKTTETWCVKFDSTEGFKPLFNAAGW